jgi:hypothetical protein
MTIRRSVHQSVVCPHLRTSDSRIRASQSESAPYDLPLKVVLITIGVQFPDGVIIQETYAWQRGDHNEVPGSVFKYNYQLDSEKTTSMRLTLSLLAGWFRDVEKLDLVSLTPNVRRHPRLCFLPSLVSTALSPVQAGNAGHSLAVHGDNFWGMELLPPSTERPTIRMILGEVVAVLAPVRLSSAVSHGPLIRKGKKTHGFTTALAIALVSTNVFVGVIIGSRSHLVRMRDSGFGLFDYIDG